MISAINTNRVSLKVTQLSPTSSPFDVYVEGLQNYREILIIMQGDSNNGVTMTIPCCILNLGIPIPFSFYSRNDSASYEPNSYSVHSQGWISYSTIHFQRIDVTNWTSMDLLVYGIK